MFALIDKFQCLALIEAQKINPSILGVAGLDLPIAETSKRIRSSSVKKDIF